MASENAGGIGGKVERGSCEALSARKPQNYLQVYLESLMGHFEKSSRNWEGSSQAPVDERALANHRKVSGN